VTQNVSQDSRHEELHSARGRSTPVEEEKATTRLNRRLEMLTVIALATIYLLWFAWPLWWSASENARLVGAFNTDEQAHLILLRAAIDSRTARLGYVQYGYAYLNMGLLPLLLLSVFTIVTEQQIIVWLRIIPSLFAIATVALTFAAARRYFGRLAAWLSALLLSLTALNFLELSVMSHSDIPQLFFLILGLYFCCRLAEDGSLRWLWWASVAAGFAFGCKYSGLFLLPILGLYALLRTVQADATQIRVNSDQVVGVSRLLATLVSAGLLLVGFVVIPHAAAPYSGAEYYGVSMPQFFNSLRVTSIVAAVGLALLAAAGPAWKVVRQRPKLARSLKLGMLSAIAFAGAFAVTSPFNIFTVRSGFARGFLYESLHSAFGHGTAAENSKLEWFSLLSSPELLDPLILGLAIVSLALTAHKLAKRGWQGLFDPESVLWVWTLCYFVFLVWRVNVRTHRALLPIVPFLLILAADAVSQVVRHAATGRFRRVTSALTVAGLLVIAGLVLPKSLDRMLEFRQSGSSREQSSEAVVAGHWLAAHYPPSARVLYDPYSYVPPAFADAHVTPWGGTLQMLETLEPDVVIASSYNSGRFSDVRQAVTYARDEAQFMARYQYYQALRGGETGFVLVRDFGSVQVYERQGGFHRESSL
jgi:hypothetical protein